MVTAPNPHPLHANTTTASLWIARETTAILNNLALLALALTFGNLFLYHPPSLEFASPARTQIVTVIAFFALAAATNIATRALSRASASIRPEQVPSTGKPAQSPRHRDHHRFHALHMGGTRHRHSDHPVRKLGHSRGIHHSRNCYDGCITLGRRGQCYQAANRSLGHPHPNPDRSGHLRNQPYRYRRNHLPVATSPPSAARSSNCSSVSEFLVAIVYAVFLLHPPRPALDRDKPNIQRGDRLRSAQSRSPYPC